VVSQTAAEAPMATKDVGLRIRISRDLREEFLDVCSDQDKPAAQILREFMRGYVATHSPTGETPRGKTGKAFSRVRK